MKINIELNKSEKTFFDSFIEKVLSGEFKYEGVFVIKKEFWEKYEKELPSFYKNHLIWYGTNGADEAIRLRLTKLGGDFLNKYKPGAREKVKWGIPFY